MKDKLATLLFYLYCFARQKISLFLEYLSVNCNSHDLLLIKWFINAKSTTHCEGLCFDGSYLYRYLIYIVFVFFSCSAISLILYY